MGRVCCGKDCQPIADVRIYYGPLVIRADGIELDGFFFGGRIYVQQLLYQGSKDMHSSRED